MDWLSLPDWTKLSNFLLAQTPSPTANVSSSPPAIPLAQEIETLKTKVDLLQQTNKALSDSLTSQINFLAKENEALNKNFSSFVDAMKWSVIILGAFGTFLTIAVA